MYLPSGDVHECEFRNGRAHGKGTYVTAKGSELRGTWDMNKRIGTFQLLDSAGHQHVETYGNDGKMISRQKVGLVFPSRGSGSDSRKFFAQRQNLPVAVF